MRFVARSSRAGAGLLLVLTAGSCGSSRMDADAIAPSDAVNADAGTPIVGTICSVPADAGATQLIYTANSPECAGNMCLKPSVQPGATARSSTTALCTAPCSQDSDCIGQNRDPANPVDTRCATGFACGILFVKGRLCCQKFCVCQDFLGPNGMVTPIACEGDAASSCQ